MARVWLSAPWPEAAASPSPGRVGFEAERYVLDVTVRKRGLRLEGTARLELDVLDSGRRAVPLELFRDLQVERVVDGKGSELFWSPMSRCGVTGNCSMGAGTRTM